MKNIVVTGAAGGMGRSVSEKLLLDGYNVIGLDKNGTDDGSILSVDLCSEESVVSAFRAVKEKCGQISAIIHLAGMYDLGSLVEMDGERLAKIFEVNFFAVCRVNRIFLLMYLSFAPDLRKSI